MQINAGGKPNFCEVSASTFLRNSLLKSHVLSHTGQKPYSCEVCNSGFSHCSDFKNHKRTHTGEKPYTCEAWGLAFSLGSKSTWEHTGEKPYSWEMCGSAFSQVSSLREHIRTQSGDKTLFNALRKSTLSKCSLKTHMRKKLHWRIYCWVWKTVACMLVWKWMIRELNNSHKLYPQLSLKVILWHYSTKYDGYNATSPTWPHVENHKNYKN